MLTMEDSADTIECLASLARMRRDDIEVILVANGSSDRCIARIHGRFPETIVIRNAENVGFAEGCNIGIRAAIEDLECTHVLLLNNDTVVQKDIIDEMMYAFNGAPDIAAVGAKIYFYDKPDLIHHIGATVDSVAGAPSHLGYAEKDSGQYENMLEQPYATAAALFTSAEIFEKVGLFDTDYFNYFEDSDWCARARALGLKIIVNPRAKVWHKVSRTVDPLWTIYIYARNRGLYIWKNHPRNFDRFVDAYAADLCRLIAKYERREEYSNILALLMGLEDFCRGNFGKGRIDEVRRINPAFRPPLRTRARVRLTAIMARRTPTLLQKRIRRMALKGKERWPLRRSESAKISTRETATANA